MHFHNPGNGALNAQQLVLRTGIGDRSEKRPPQSRPAESPSPRVASLTSSRPACRASATPIRLRQIATARHTMEAPLRLEAFA